MNQERVIGQKEILAQLKNMVDNDKLPHALFLKGQPGFGPLPIALALSSYLLTPEIERTHLAESRSYTKAMKFIHPDLNFAFPVVKHPSKKRSDTTSRDFIKEWRIALTNNPYMTDPEWIISISTSTSVGDINVAECNQIISNLSLKPFESKHKVQIIWMPQHLGNNGNKLLKLIEEPPENSNIIFVGNSVESVLSTITSRCQIINIPRIDDESIIHALEEKHGIDTDKARRISFLAEGDYNQAQKLISIQDDVSLDFVLSWLQVSASGNALLIKNWINSFNDLGKEEQKGIIIYFLKILRELIHINIIGIERSKLSESERVLIQKDVTLNKLTIEHISDISNIVNSTYVLLERNANPRILLFQSSLQIGKIIKMSTLATEV